MPRQKDLKRLVRARMQKTGEAYTAARANILMKSRAKTGSPTVAAAHLSAAEQKNFAELAGMSDAMIEDKTGCTWERWVYALDRQRAEQMSHRDIAALVKEKYKVSPWWTQTVTIGYERIKGLRTRGQQRNGTFEMTKSRTFNVPVTTLFDAWANARVRRRWLSGVTVKVRTATTAKSMQLDWPDGGIVAVGFLAKGASKSAVAVGRARLPDRESADRQKLEWSARLDALGEMLAPGDASAAQFS